MEVCDRCKKPMKEKQRIKLDNQDFDLCQECGKHIADHIRQFNGDKKGLLNKLIGGG